MQPLHKDHCQHYSNEAVLTPSRVQELLSSLPHWQVTGTASIQRQFEFQNYSQTTSFINAVAFIAQQQDHHPDISFGYNCCTIVFTTHSVGGLSMNDFICAARIDHLDK